MPPANESLFARRLAVGKANDVDAPGAESYSQTINVKTSISGHAGAKGDGVTDDTAAINRALAADTTTYFPPGKYKYVGAITLPANKPCRIYGDGPGNSTIQFFGNPLAGIYAPNLQNSTLQIESLTLQGNTANCGTAIYALFNDPPPPGIQNNTKFRTATIRNVEITGSDRTLTPAGYWAGGIFLSKGQNALIEDVQIHGYIETSGVAIDWNSTTDYATTQLFLHNIYLAHFKTGIHTSGWVEGLYLSDFEMLFCGSTTTPAVDLTSTSVAATNLPSFNILGGHIDSLGSAIRMTNLSAIKIAHVNLFMQEYNGTHVELVNCLNAIVSECDFGSNGLSPEENGVLCNGSSLVRISGNIFRGLPQPVNGNCIVAVNHSTQIKAVDNLFQSVGRKYFADAGSDLFIREN